MTFDEDEIRQSLQRNLEGMEVPRDVPPDTMRRGRARRLTWTVGTVALIVVVLVGGIAGGMTLIRDDADTDLAPQPEETSGCVSVGYDLAVGVADGAKDEEISALEARLRDDERVVKVWFVPAEDATRTYLAENPNHEGPIPSAHAVDQFRLVLVDDLKPNDERVLREFAEIGDGAYAPALRCPPKQPQQKFARYFFDVDEGNASASGTLEVDWEQRELCLEVETRNIKASHLLFRDPSAPDGRGQVVFTFFDSSSEDEAGPTLPPTGTHCFREAQLGELDDELLAELVDTPQRFQIDFHRGPNDEPGLVAQLRTQPYVKTRRCPFPNLHPRYLPWQEEGEQRGKPLRSYDENEDRAALSWLDPSGAGILLTLSPQERPTAAERTDVLIDGARGYFHRGQGDDVYLSWDVGGRCNLLQLGGSLPVVEQGRVKPELIKIAHSLAPTTKRPSDSPPFSSIQEAVEYLSDRMNAPVALPTKLPKNVRLHPAQAVSVDREGGIRTAQLKLRFGKEGILGIQFGRAIFDGCGGDAAVVVDINGAAGLMLAKDRYPWTQIIWPAEPGDRSATYGIYGSLRSDEMLELARSMDLAMQGEGKPAGC